MTYIYKHKLLLKWVVVVIVIPAVIVTTIISYIIYQKGHHHWLPTYAWSFVVGSHPLYTTDKIEHVMVVIADHHEQPFGEAAPSPASNWLKAYLETVQGLTDSYGNPVKYTWYYPYDHKRSEVVLLLNKAVYDGYGEIEFHWHHSHSDSVSFEQDLSQAVQWFSEHGAFISNPGEQPKFSFIHGNWSLDNSLGDRYCGINNEIDLLSKYGGYMDLTFYCCTNAQPSMSAALYYVTDDEESKSYDKGDRVRVGRIDDRFLMMTGPVALDFHTLHFEFGQIESYWGSKWDTRVPLWINNSPYVMDRPEWRFVKLYTHGVQSKSLILSDRFREMWRTLESYSKNHQVKLHYVTAREAYNIIKAAEAGLNEDPEKYRDYLIKPPLNTRILVDKKLEFSQITWKEFMN